ncbi:hypothetical protein Hamer_G014841 [Homarus americanus]|uniref:Uncharacterized protein n=1 Tax=Homarus americanus TaxID=6706 RepID=A0A8J5JM00_HOMAM|nr:hypothetical protein Hamer_G014841 [Homarus americanus]
MEWDEENSEKRQRKQHLHVHNINTELGYSVLKFSLAAVIHGIQFHSASPARRCVEGGLFGQKSWACVLIPLLFMKNVSVLRSCGDDVWLAWEARSFWQAWCPSSWWYGSLGNTDDNGTIVPLHSLIGHQGSIFSVNFVMTRKITTTLMTEV